MRNYLISPIGTQWVFQPLCETQYARNSNRSSDCNRGAKKHQQKMILHRAYETVVTRADFCIFKDFRNFDRNRNLVNNVLMYICHYYHTLPFVSRYLFSAVEEGHTRLCKMTKTGNYPPVENIKFTPV